MNVRFSFFKRLVNFSNFILVWRLYAHQRLSKIELLTIVCNIKGNIMQKIELMAHLDNELRERYKEAFVGVDNGMHTNN